MIRAAASAGLGCVLKAPLSAHKQRVTHLSPLNHRETHQYSSLFHSLVPRVAQMAPKRARASNAAETKSASSGLFLIKSEPDDFSLDDLANKETECWDGVRNPIARKHLRAMSVGDQVLFYHSSCKDVGVVGVAEVTRDAYPDPSQFDASSKYYDPKSTQEQPRWDSVDVKFVSRLPRTVGLKELKEIAAAPGEGQDVLSDFALLRMSRLSVMPVEQRVWDFILALADQEPPEPKKKKRKSKAKAEDSDGGSDGQ